MSDEGDSLGVCKVCGAAVPTKKLPDHYTWHLTIDTLKWQHR